MEKNISLREPMSMPDPLFPIKLSRTVSKENGKTLFSHHWHPHIEFLFFTEGEALIECNSYPMKAKAGDLIVVNSNDLHYGVNVSDNLSYLVIIVDTSLLHSHSADAAETKYITPITQNRILFPNQIRDDAAIRDCISSLIEEYEGRETGFELAIKSCLYRLLTLLLRSGGTRFLSRNEYDRRMENLARFNPILQYIEENYREKLSVELLADMVCMSRFHFSRLFKELTNKTVTEYINLVRIQISEQQLRHSPMRVSEIALASGFSDIYYFSRMFKKKKGVSPAEFRKQCCLSEVD